MPWEERDIMSERMCFVSRLEAGERMTDLCREHGISRKTGYKFWDRYRRFGPVGLYDESSASWNHLNMAQVTGDGLWVEGTVPHFSSIDCNLPVFISRAAVAPIIPIGDLIFDKNKNTHFLLENTFNYNYLNINQRHNIGLFSQLYYYTNNGWRFNFNIS